MMVVVLVLVDFRIFMNKMVIESISSVLFLVSIYLILLLIILIEKNFCLRMFISGDVFVVSLILLCVNGIGLLVVVNVIR